MNFPAFLVTLLFGCLSGCPVGWIDAGGEFCYLTSPNKMNWPSAQVVILFSSCPHITSGHVMSRRKMSLICQYVIWGLSFSSCRRVVWWHAHNHRDWSSSQDHLSNLADLFSIQYCWDHGGYLAELFTGEEEGALDQILLDDGQYLLGLSDTALEGEVTEGILYKA